MVAKTRTSKQTKKTTKKPVEKKPVTKKEVKPVTRRTRVKKSEIQASETLAVDCCSALKKSLASGSYAGWDEIGSGENCKLWFQIKGLRLGNNIAISKEGEGRKKKYMLYVLSTQGTEVECEFDTFTYKHSKGKLEITFSLADKTMVKHIVKYGDDNE